MGKIKNEKKIVLVTGSSRGIGKSCVTEFAKKGYSVVINYNKNEREAKKLEENILKEYNIETLLIKADISKEDQVKNMIDLIINKFEKIDVLVNNAGVEIDKPFEQRKLEDFKNTFEVNVYGLFLVTKYVSKHMMDKKTGVIINISSTSGYKYSDPQSIDYNASKAAVISLTHDFAMQFQPFIRVNAIAPGWIDTDLNNNLGEDFYKKEKEKIYLKRIGKPEDVAKLAVFLASDDANYINNEVIIVDGGM